MLLGLISTSDVDNLFFRPADENLNSFYTKLVSNKFFNQELNKLGYSNLVKEADKYIINKESNEPS